MERRKRSAGRCPRAALFALVCFWAVNVVWMGLAVSTRDTPSVSVASVATAATTDPPTVSATTLPTESRWVSRSNITNFNALRLDWHDLIGDIQPMAALVAKEVAVVGALLDTAPLKVKWGVTHSNIASMDARLKKCASMTSGVDRAASIFRVVDPREYPNTHTLKVRPTQTECVVYTTKKLIPLGGSSLTSPFLASRLTAMWYHFLREFFMDFASRNYRRADEIAIVLPNAVAYDWPFVAWVEALVTDECAIRAEDIPNNACMLRDNSVELPQEVTQQERTSILDIAISRFGIKSSNDRPTKLSIVHRIHKRLIVNVDELSASAAGCFDAVEVLPFELMTPFEQVFEVYTSSVMAGVHGSGLSNVVFFEEPTTKTLIEILPLGVSCGDPHSGIKPLANQVRASYECMTLHRNEVFLHKHFLSQEDADTIENRIVGSAPLPTSGGFFFAFLVNQDVKPDAARFARQACAALAAGQRSAEQPEDTKQS